MTISSPRPLTPATFDYRRYRAAAAELLRLGIEGEVLKPKELRKRVADTARARAEVP